MKGKPSEWADAVVKGYKKYDCDLCVYETNQGGLMVESTIHNADSKVKTVGVHASKGKAVRAEPVSILYEQGRVHHVGELPELETEMTQFNPALGRNQKSPNRLDAVVYALTELFGDDDESYE